MKKKFDLKSSIIFFCVADCNSTSQCDNGVCIHPDWWCNNITECRDGKDEIHCNGSRPIPPAPAPVPSKGGKKTGGKYKTKVSKMKYQALESYEET